MSRFVFMHFAITRGALVVVLVVIGVKYYYNKAEQPPAAKR